MYFYCAFILSMLLLLMFLAQFLKQLRLFARFKFIGLVLFYICVCLFCFVLLFVWWWWWWRCYDDDDLCVCVVCLADFVCHLHHTRSPQNNHYPQQTNQHTHTQQQQQQQTNKQTKSGDQTQANNSMFFSFVGAIIYGHGELRGACFCFILFVVVCLFVGGWDRGACFELFIIVCFVVSLFHHSHSSSLTTT